MSNPLDDNHFKPLFDGMPIVLRLINGEEVLAVVYHNPDDDRVMLERPLAIHFENSETQDNPLEQMNITRVRTRFERWVPLSSSEYFPIYLDLIMTMAPLADTILEAYIEWAEKLYANAITFREITPSQTDEKSDAFPAQLPEGVTVDEIRQSYFDFILHNFKPKGKPN